MEGRETICECEEYEGTDICGKGEWNGSIEGPSGVGDEIGKKGGDDKKCETGLLGLGLTAAKDQMRDLK